MAFDDGTPLDAAALQALDTKLNEIRSSIPKIGSSTTNVTNVTNQTINQINTEIRGGITPNFINLVAGKAIPFNIKWGNEPLSGTPISITLTPAKSNSQEPTGAISYTIDTNSVNSTGCSGHVYLESGAKPFTIKFYWLAVTA